MKLEGIIAMARDAGFETVAELDVSTLQFLPEVRDMCSADRCRSFNRSWSCPPACGSLEEISARCRAYSRGILVQTVGRREDEFDFESIMRVEELHKKRFAALTDKLFKAGESVYPMGSGACTICAKCSYPDSPCRFPDRAHSSMEANGLFVSQVCKDNGVKYYYGPDSICFVACCLFK
ncbi:MAG: DUF2284 domain-containing protein [Candidatus Heteroscillospira sp.]|jgi:predicted metal-binding protein